MGPDSPRAIPSQPTAHVRHKGPSLKAEVENSIKKQIKADSEYWQKLAGLLRWTLFGFSGRATASYYINDNDKIIQLSGLHRDTIVTTIETLQNQVTELKAAIEELEA